LTEVKTIAEMTTDGKLNGPPNLDKFFYDKNLGILFFWVAQTDPNARGPSPLGNCTGSASDPPFCPDHTTDESYYICPPEGCSTYRIVLNDPNYVPGQSDCSVESVYGPYSWPAPPSNENVLVRAGTTTPIEQDQQPGVNDDFPHYVSKTPLTCPMTTP
jgi:hypothetical protein